MAAAGVLNLEVVEDALGDIFQHCMPMVLGHLDSAFFLRSYSHSITWSAFLVRLNFLIEIDGFEGRYTLTRCNLALLSARSAHETS